MLVQMGGPGVQMNTKKTFVFGGLRPEDREPDGAKPPAIMEVPLPDKPAVSKARGTFMVWIPEVQLTPSPAPSQPAASPTPPQSAAQKASCPPSDPASEPDPDPPHE